MQNINTRQTWIPSPLFTFVCCSRVKSLSMADVLAHAVTDNPEPSFFFFSFFFLIEKKTLEGFLDPQESSF